MVPDVVHHIDHQLGGTASPLQALHSLGIIRDHVVLEVCDVFQGGQQLAMLDAYIEIVSINVPLCPMFSSVLLTFGGSYIRIKSVEKQSGGI